MIDHRFPWKWRRLCVFGALGICGFILLYLTLYGSDTRLNETLVSGSFALAGAVIGSYVFGAVWHDKNVMRSPTPPSEKENP